MTRPEWPEVLPVLLVLLVLRLALEPGSGLPLARPLGASQVTAWA